MAVDAALSGVDGLLLTGGDDVAPPIYGEQPHATITDAEPGRDEFEIGLVKAARERGVPIFAICRGVQVLNVACGGTLVQDIPSLVKGAMTHDLPVPPNQSYSLAHEIWLEKDSLLSILMRERLSDADACDVNSRHGSRAWLPGERHRAGWRDRSDRGSGKALLPRRSVAPGEFLPHRRVPAALRRLPRSRTNQVNVAQGFSPAVFDRRRRPFRRAAC